MTYRPATSWPAARLRASAKSQRICASTRKKMGFTPAARSVSNSTPWWYAGMSTLLPARPRSCTASHTALRAKYRYRVPSWSKGKTRFAAAAGRGTSMCGQAVCMHGTVRRGTGARSPFPSATHILRARSAKFSASANAARLRRFARRGQSPRLPHGTHGAPRSARHRPQHETRFVDQLCLSRRPEDAQPAVRPQGRFPVPLPVHVGAEEIELDQAPLAGIADRLARELLAGRVFVERLVVPELHEIMLCVVHYRKVRRDADAFVHEETKGERAPLRGIARDLRVEPDQLRPLGDGGAAASFPARGLDGEEVREGDVERLGILAVQKDVPGFTLLREPALPAPEVLAELRIEARLDQVVPALRLLRALLLLAAVRDQDRLGKLRKGAVRRLEGSPDSAPQARGLGAIADGPFGGAVRQIAQAQPVPARGGDDALEYRR